MTPLRFLPRRSGCLVLLAASMLCTGLAGPSHAQSAYSADDIVSRFSTAVLGKKKAVCFGTEDECKDAKASAPASGAVSPMDLVVTFERDSFVLRPEAKRNLSEFAKALKDPRLAGMKFEVAGHTDAQGSDEYNQALSEQRAAAVVRFLTEQGVPTTQLVPKGFGRTMPRAPDPLDPSNRRVETRPVG